jgi:zf-RING of BARD1-type protein
MEVIDLDDSPTNTPKNSPLKESVAGERDGGNERGEPIEEEGIEEEREDWIRRKIEDENVGEDSKSKREEVLRSRVDTLSPLIGEWKDFEETLKCSLCRSFFDAPVSLKCSHVFCSFCIRKHFEFRGSNCPVCRSTAGSQDLRLDSVSAGLVRKLSQNQFRKRLRKAFVNGGGGGGEQPIPATKNPTFLRQGILNDVFRRNQGISPVLERTILPSYKDLKQVKALLVDEGLFFTSQNKEEMVKYHKEFVFLCQSVLDGYKLGVYDSPPIKKGIVEYLNSSLAKQRTLSRSQQWTAGKLLIEASPKRARELLVGFDHEAIRAKARRFHAEFLRGAVGPP